MFELLKYFAENPISTVSLAAIIVMVVFQMAQMGIIDIRIGKTDKNRYTHWSREAKNERRIDAVVDDMNEVKADIKNIKENHLAHIQADMTTVREDIAFIKGKLSK